MGGQDVITHLIDQWKDSYRHKTAIKLYCENFDENENIGVITRDYQSARIDKMVKKISEDIDKLSKELDKMPNNVVKKRKETDLIKIKKTYDLLNKFFQGIVEIDDKIFRFQIFELKGADNTYKCDIDAFC